MLLMGEAKSGKTQLAAFGCREADSSGTSHPFTARGYLTKASGVRVTRCNLKIKKIFTFPC